LFSPLQYALITFNKEIVISMIGVYIDKTFEWLIIKRTIAPLKSVKLISNHIEKTQRIHKVQLPYSVAYIAFERLSRLHSKSSVSIIKTHGSESQGQSDRQKQNAQRTTVCHLHKQTFSSYDIIITVDISRATSTFKPTL